MTKLRAYSVSYGDEGCELVIAKTAREAKKVAWNESEWLKDCGDFIELQVKWLKGGTDDLEEGLYNDFIEALKRGWFSSVHNVECPTCGSQDTACYLDQDGKVMCRGCELSEQDNEKTEI